MTFLTPWPTTDGTGHAYDELGPTTAAPLAGDATDDDGQALDDTLIPNPNGDELTLPVEILDDVAGYSVDFEDSGPTPCTRILTGKLPLSTDAFCALPRDPNRVHLMFVADVDIQFASDKTDCYGAGTLPASAGVILDRHTGPLWARVATGTGTLQYWAVTR